MTTDVLAQPTLVLNRQWQPVHVASVARAVILLCNDAARVVDPEDYRLMSWDEWIQLEPDERCAVHPLGPAAAQGARGHLPGALRSAAEHRGDVQPSQRRQARSLRLPVLRSAAGSRVRSRSTTSCRARRAGPSNWTNCAAACLECNTRKGDRTPEQAGMRLRRRPVRPEWKPFYAAGVVPVESWSRFLKHEPALALA